MDIKDVENLAALVRIDISDSEKNSLLEDMRDILGYVKAVEGMKAGEIDVEHRVYNVWREDRRGVQEFSPELITEQFPNSQDNFLKVKKIL